MVVQRPNVDFEVTRRVVTPVALAGGLAYTLMPTSIVNKLGAKSGRIGEHAMQIVTLMLRIAAGERSEDIGQVQQANADHELLRVFDHPEHMWWVNAQLWIRALDTYLHQTGNDLSASEEDTYLAAYRYCGQVLGIGEDRLGEDLEAVRDQLDTLGDQWLMSGEIVDRRAPALFWQVVSAGPVAEALGDPPLGTVMELLRTALIPEEYGPFENEYARLTVG